MKCPKCGNPKYKYVYEKKAFKVGEGRKKSRKRENYSTNCNKCGYGIPKGEGKDE